MAGFENNKSGRDIDSRPLPLSSIAFGYLEITIFPVWIKVSSLVFNSTVKR